jgi:hypothetical protein
VFTIPKLTKNERERLVEGFLLYESKGEYQNPEEREKQIEQLIKDREDGKSRHRNTADR